MKLRVSAGSSSDCCVRRRRWRRGEMPLWKLLCHDFSIDAPLNHHRPRDVIQRNKYSLRVLETDRHWKRFESGSLLGATGSEGGVILRDEEFASSARITLEQSGSRFAITCGVYGWMVHTRFFAAREAAERELDEMKSVL